MVLLNNIINMENLLQQGNPSDNKCCYITAPNCFPGIFEGNVSYFICKFTIYDYIIKQLYPSKNTNIQGKYI